VAGAECPRCGVIYAKAYARAPAVPDDAPVLTLGPQDELPAAAARPPHLPPESAGWAGAGQDAQLERRLRTWAIPGALLGFALVHATGPGRFLMRAFFGREVHECGHALTGWLFGFPSVPLLWVSISSAHHSPLAILAIAAGLASVAVWRGRAGDRRWATVWAGLLVLQLAASLGSSERTAQMFITFGGDAGCLVLGPLLMALFLLGPERWVNRGWLRWGYLVIGAAAFVDVFSGWWAARTDVDRIPFGEIEGVGLSDPSKLNEIYGWSADALVHRHVALGLAALAALALLYVATLAGMRAEAGRARGPRTG
jgi:hypothetical protein